MWLDWQCVILFTGNDAYDVNTVGYDTEMQFVASRRISHFNKMEKNKTELRE